MKPTREEKQTAALAFGERLGWRLSKTAFGIETLARNGVYSRAGWHRDQLRQPYIDHAYSYRNNRRAVAIAAHLHYVPEDVHEQAARHGLRAYIEPDKSKSWYLPGQTTLVVYTAANEPTSFEHEARRRCSQQ